MHRVAVAANSAMVGQYSFGHAIGLAYSTAGLCASGLGGNAVTIDCSGPSAD